MNTFTKAVFLMLAAGSASAHSVNGALRAQVDEAKSQVYPPSSCVPNERPQTQNGNANKTRFRFNFEKSDSVCADDEGVEYEWGEYDKADDSDDCADMCTNDTPTSLANVLRGFNFDCNDNTCQCLYDEGTLNNGNARSFKSSNYQTRSRKARGSVAKTVRKNDYYCFKLVGAELTEEGLEMFHKTHAYLNSLAA
ncbi:hypothetical protein ACHAXR_001389 [Thalassiosira sp. AJA248-18]